MKEKSCQNALFTEKREQASHFYVNRQTEKNPEFTRKRELIRAEKFTIT